MRLLPSLILLLGVSGCAPGAPTVRSAPAAARARPYVVVVSLDAVRHDYPERYRMPALEQIAASGIRARALVPPFPSKTFPSHYTIATGLYPGHHGIIGNTFYDAALDRWFRVKDSNTVRDGRWYGGEPIWVAAEREGVKTGVYFWSGSEGAVQGVRPTYWKRYLMTVPDSVRIDESMGWLRLAPAARPHLVMIYLSDVDDTTHTYGPDTPHTGVAIASLDRALRRLLDSVRAMPLRDSVNFVVLSDHGMADAPQEKMIALRPALIADGIDTAAVRMGDNGPTMALWFGGDTALARRTRATLTARLTHARVYARGETPAAWHLEGNSRAGELLVVGELGYVIAKSASDRLIDLGTHGWDPVHPEMHGIFVASGPQIRSSGVVPEFENVHVFPFLAALLRLEHAPHVDGHARVLAPYLRSAARD